MRKKRLLLLVWLFVMFASVCIFVTLLKPDPVKVSFDHVHVGMNEKTVNDIFGRTNNGLWACQPGFLRWVGASGDAMIVVDEQGIVTNKRWFPTD